MSTNLHPLLNSIWGSLTRSLSSGVANKWREVVLSMYGEPQRHYHTVKHIEEMLAYRNEHLEKLKDVAAVDYAIIFHDLVYEPKKSDNEEQSAQMFQDFAKEAELSENITSSVAHLILATKTHSTPVHLSVNKYGTEDLHYMLDFDMAVLGRETKGYEEYANQIRQEYIHIPEKTYCEKRAEVLKSFLQTPNIFATKDFRDRAEQQARKNIEKEISELEAKAASL